MSSLPPVAEIVDALISVILPSVCTTAFTAFLIGRIQEARTRSLMFPLALIAGMTSANYFRGCFVFQFDSDLPFSIADLLRGLWGTVTGQSVVVGGSVDDPLLAPKAGRYWIPWAALISGAAAALIRLPIPPAPSYCIRFAVAFIVGRMVVPANLAVEMPWMSSGFALIMFFTWSLYDLKWDGLSLQISPFVMSIVAMGAAAVIIHAHSARLTDVEVMVAMSAATLWIVALWMKLDCGGTTALTTVIINGVLVAGYYETFSEVPAMSYLLPALAPLSLVILPVLPEKLRSDKLIWLTSAVLAGLPTLISVILAMRAEQLDFGSH